MPKTAVRLSLDVSPELNATLEQMAEEIHGSKSDVLRRAIALIEVAIKAKKDGRPFGIGEVGQKLATEIVGL